MLVAGIVWIVVTGLLARHRMDDVNRTVPQLRTALVRGDLDQARQMVARVRNDVHDARSMVGGPAWWVGSNIPGLGTPLHTARVATASADRLTDVAVPELIDAAQAVGDSTVSSSGIRLDGLSEALPGLERAVRTTSTIQRDVAGTPASSWLSPVDDARASLVRSVDTLHDQVDAVTRVARTAVPMLGGDGTRRYFVGFENEAEARGIGGLPGAFAIVAVDHGRLTFEHFGNDTELGHVRADVALPADYRQRYDAADPAGVYANSDIGADFRDAATIWTAMWQRRSGQRLDGAIAIDPSALGYLLAVTGPASLPGGGTITAHDVVRLTQQAQYSAFPDGLQRKAYLVAVARAVASSVLRVHDQAALLQAVQRAGRERRLLLWSAHPDEERELAASQFGGTLNPGSDPYTGLTVVNAAGTKLDFYLFRTLTYRRTSCADGATAQVTISLRNDAPRQGLPSYVTTRNDRPAYRTSPGDNLVTVTYYGTPGAQVASFRIDGAAQTAAVGTERGVLTASKAIELPAGQTRTITVTVREPAAHGPTRTLVQPAVRPVTTTVQAPACSK